MHALGQRLIWRVSHFCGDVGVSLASRSDLAYSDGAVGS